MNDYVAVVRRSGGDDELQHFKYIKREKRNGKWVYFYDNSELNKFNQGKTEVKTGRDRFGKTKTTTKYEKTNKLLGGERRITWNGETDVIKTQGKLDRAVAKGEKVLYEKVLKKMSGKIAAGDEIKKKAAKSEELVMKTLGLDKREALKDQEKNEKKQRLEVDKSVVDADMKRSKFEQNSSKENRDSYNESARDYAKESAKYEQEKNKTERIRQDYYKTPVGKIAKATDAGKQKLNDLFDKETYDEAKQRHRYDAQEAAVKAQSEKLKKADAEQKQRDKERQSEKDRIYNSDKQRELRKKRLARGR